MTFATRTIDGNNSGPLTNQPKIVVIHATRSGIVTKTDVEELLSTLNWFTNPDGASAHWVLSETERVRVVADELLAWHSARLNGLSWGMELTQPTIDRLFTDGHYANAALVGRHYVSLGVAPIWLPYWDGNTTDSGFVAHEDTIQGRQSGKTDPGPEFDRPRFISSLTEEDDMAISEAEWQRFKDLLVLVRNDGLEFPADPGFPSVDVQLKAQEKRLRDLIILVRNDGLVDTHTPGVPSVAAQLAALEQGILQAVAEVAVAGGTTPDAVIDRLKERL